MAKLRLLALHSFRTSGRIFAEQMRRAGLDKALEDLVDLVYIDSPNAATGPIPEDVKPYFDGPYYEWWSAEKDEERDMWVYKGWEKSLAFITEYVEQHGPFDGMMGFSQGGCLTSLVVGMQRTGLVLQSVPPLKCCVIFAGVLSRDKRHSRVYERDINCPSLHVYGEKDPLKKYSETLLESFINPVVITHPRGHVIPALQGESLQRMRAFLAAQLQPSSL